jgi:FtsH-binding integral membrane protein
MNRFSDVFSGSRPFPSMDTMFKMNDVSPTVQTHLVQVYGALTATLLAASVGAWAHLQFHLGGMLTGIACFGMMMVMGSDADKSFNNRRLGMLMGFGFFKGCSIGPLVEQALWVDPAIIVTACLMTTTIFAAFSAAALFTKRRQYLFLGGVLGSILTFMCVLSLLRFFVPSLGSVFSSTAELYLGLVVFCAYVLFDTQMIVEKASGGDRDSVWHAMELFIDFVAIFVRILIILMRNNGGRSEKKDERRRR